MTFLTIRASLFCMYPQSASERSVRFPSIIGVLPFLYLPLLFSARHHISTSSSFISLHTLMRSPHGLIRSPHFQRANSLFHSWERLGRPQVPTKLQEREKDTNLPIYKCTNLPMYQWTTEPTYQRYILTLSSTKDIYQCTKNTYHCTMQAVAKNNHHILEFVFTKLRDGIVAQFCCWS